MPKLTPLQRAAWEYAGPFFGTGLDVTVSRGGKIMGSSGEVTDPSERIRIAYDGEMIIGILAGKSQAEQRVAFVESGVAEEDADYALCHWELLADSVDVAPWVFERALEYARRDQNRATMRSGVSRHG